MQIPGFSCLYFSAGSMAGSGVLCPSWILIYTLRLISSLPIDSISPAQSGFYHPHASENAFAEVTVPFLTIKCSGMMAHLEC